MHAIMNMELPPKDAAAVFLKGLQDKEHTVRTLAVAALADVGPESPDVVPALLKAMEDPSANVSQQAAKALKGMELAPAEAVAFLLS